MAEQQKYAPTFDNSYRSHIKDAQIAAEDTGRVQRRDSAFLTDLFISKYDKDMGDWFYNQAVKEKANENKVIEDDDKNKNKVIVEEEVDVEPDIEIKTNDGRTVKVNEYADAKSKEIIDKLGKGIPYAELVQEIAFLHKIHKLGKKVPTKPIKKVFEKIIKTNATGKGLEDAMNFITKVGKDGKPYQEFVEKFTTSKFAKFGKNARKIMKVPIIQGIFAGMDMVDFYNTKDKSWKKADNMIISSGELGLAAAGTWGPQALKSATTSGAGGVMSGVLAGTEITGQVYKYLMENAESKVMQSELTGLVKDRLAGLNRELTDRNGGVAVDALEVLDVDRDTLPTNEQRASYDFIAEAVKGIEAKSANDIYKRYSGNDKDSGIGRYTTLMTGWAAGSPEEQSAKAFIQSHGRDADKQLQKSIDFWKNKYDADPFNTEAYMKMLDLRYVKSPLRRLLKETY